MDFRKKIKGLCYTEEVLDCYGKPVTRILFNNECCIIPEATNYLRYLRITSTGSYNTLSLVARDLCYFFDYLTISNIKIDDIDIEQLSGFIKYLSVIKVKPETNSKNDFKRNKYSIERSLYNSLPLVSHYKDPKIKNIRLNSSLDEKSISRIFNRCILFLTYLTRENKNNLKMNILNFTKNKARNNFLRANGISAILHEIEQVEEEMIFLDEEIMELNSVASTGYERFLYFILEKTGIRIGEALGLKIYGSGTEQLKAIQGDLYFKNGNWIISVIWRSANKNFCLAKGHTNRYIVLKESDSAIFELLLERYLKWRQRVLENKSSEWLFINNRGMQLTQNTAYSKFLRSLSKAALVHKEKLTLHSFRHTFASNLIKCGMPLEFVAKLLGHKDPETTRKIYMHLTGRDIKEIRKRYESGLEKN